MARDVFLEEGYAAASMATIAARVGGSKGTLYNYFKSKDDLFVAYVQRHCVWQKDAMFGLFADEPDVASALTLLGRSYLRIVLGDTNLRNFQTIVAEAPRAPELGRAFFEAGPAVGTVRLGEYLRAMAAKGLLNIDSPSEAAEDFIALCQNRLWKARLCNVSGEPTDAEIDHQVARAVKVFLAAYGPKD